MEHKSFSLKIWFGVLVVVTIALAVSYPHGGTLWRNLSTPHSGEREVLPPDALFVLDYTRQNRVKSVTLSKLLAGNRFLAQPITESIYPTVVNDRGEIYLSFVSEPLPSGCASLKTSKGVRIAACR